MNAHKFLIELTLTPAGRHIAFSKEMLEKVHVYRRVIAEGAAWEQVAANVRSPFVDTYAFPPGTTVEYHVQHFNQQDAYEGHSNIVRTTLN
ncbi:hypothetical protein E4631_25270 [Hymenobacter sp. UV11]|jgi:hypothetical protein|uniref:hypothetical protein n=1 Tax=Hymenobacter sp. UV11 TaxID=1849735 RepID=UPI00105E2CCA|nr:hypothetical protein [Hymenobacter sp. UV11]TDN37241.1 hypothetical protein A8B98_04835 [Hymenobacter sp. UV11]TFZ62364.1 hypothetical protein E4631_25270 [Hymenobacter sp. UV11]